MGSDYLYYKDGLIGNARETQIAAGILGHKDRLFESTFSLPTIVYLDERIINHILDSLILGSPTAGLMSQAKGRFNDFSFFVAPAYKALEGYLFQIAEDLKLPSSGSPKMVGGHYYDEDKINKHMDKLLKELEDKAATTVKLSKDQKDDIKSRITDMRGFLKNYRHAPAHFYGHGINTTEKAYRSIQTIYEMIDATTQTLLDTGLLKIKHANDSGPLG